MKITLCLIIVLFTCWRVMAEIPEGQTVETFPWNIIITPDPTGTHFSFFNSGTNQTSVVAGVEDASDPNNPLSAPVLIQYNGKTPLQFQFTQWPNGSGTLPLTTHHFAFIGEVQYENVSAGSYLEMWSHFASPAPGYPEQAYFSRTLADSGPMGKLEGTHDWREFSLPFDATGTKTRLVQLEMNLHLTGPGTVHLRNMKLVQYPDASIPTAGTGAQAAALPETVQPPNSTIISPQVIATLPVEKYADPALDLGHQAQISFPSGIDGTKDLLLTRSGDGWYQTGLLAMPPELMRQVTSARFGFVGEIKSTHAVSLTMGLGFVPRVDSSPTILEPHSDLPPAQEWRNFEIQFDRGHSGLVLEHLRLWLNLYGSGTIELRHLKLVQYPEPASVSPAAETPRDISQAPALATSAASIDWKSFLLGVTATGASLLASGGIIFISRQWSRRRHERELRRIASLDS